MKTIIKNKKAFFDYEILESREAGIELFGHEVKSLRAGWGNLKGSYISFVGWIPHIKNMHISPWKTLVARDGMAPTRERKIFLHKKTIQLLLWKQKIAGLAIVPLEVYFSGSLVKVKVGLCKGRKQYDKKQLLKERTLEKEAQKTLKNFTY